MLGLLARRCSPGHVGLLRCSAPLSPLIPGRQLPQALKTQRSSFSSWISPQSHKATLLKRFFSTELKSSASSSSPSSSSSSQIPWRQKVVATWLAVSGGLVYGIIVLGGLTRLTESGLSIVEWKPLAGAVPPSSLEDWMVEFDKYKKSPEFLINNYDISLNDFKKIFWMEWAHRQMGRFIGLEFLLPAAFFIARGWVSRPMAYRLAGITGLIGFQGLIGWLMVKSGLDHQIVEDQAVPRVSHYRLAAHLGTALTIYGAMLWSAFDLFAKPIQDPKVLQALRSPKVARFKTFSLITLGMVATTAMSGALVAGLDAGLVYNEFPLMGGRIIPTDLLSMSPTWKNFLENTTTVQFNHRYLAITTASAIGALFMYSRKLPLPRQVKMAAHMFAGMVAIQVTLGITTLVYFVPLPVASAHQGGSVALLSFGLWLLHTLKAVPK